MDRGQSILIQRPDGRTSVQTVAERFARLSANSHVPSSYHGAPSPLSRLANAAGRRGSDSSEDSLETKDSLTALPQHHPHHSLYQSSRGAASMPDVPRVLSESRYANGVMTNGTTTSLFSRTDHTRSSGSSAEESSAGSASSTGGRVAPPRRRLPPTPSPERHASPTPVSRPSSSHAGRLGLTNIGNTCFMNSMLQCLSHTKPLRDLALGRPTPFQAKAASGGKLMRAFSDLMELLWSESRSSHITPSDFKSAVQKFAPRFVGYSQQDSQEFLRYLLCGIHEELNRAVPNSAGALVDDSLPPERKAVETWNRYLRIDNSPIVDMFVGQLRSELRCTHCDHLSTTFDPFWDLSLPLPAGADLSLRACLAAFTKQEVLDGNEKPKCERCNTHRKCTKQLGIQRFPKILVLRKPSTLVF